MPLRLTRREFIKATLAAATATAVSGASVKTFLLKEKQVLEQAGKPKDQVRYFVCRICGGGCVLKGYVNSEGVLYKIEGDPKDWVSHGTPCVKGKTSHLILYDPDRLRKPLKRTNPDRGFERGPNGEVLGVKDPGWTEVSWDEALDAIAEKIVEAVKTWGPQSIVFIGHGRGKALASLIGTPNVVKHHTTCHSTWDVTLKPMYGGIPNADMANSKLIVSFGFDQGAGKSKNPFPWMFAEAKRRGAELIVFEPRLSETANKATEWIPIKPGTDLAVLLAILHTIIYNDMYDEEFTIRYTNGPILVDKEKMTYIKDSNGNLLVYDEAIGGVVPLQSAKSPALEWEGEIGGQQVATAFKLIKERVKDYTPEWAEQVSGVPADKIREVAWKLANVKPASIPHWKRSGGTGPNRSQGVESYKVIGIIMAITGNVERAGGWLFMRNAKFISKAISKKAKKSFSEIYPIPDEYKGKTVDEREKFPVYSKHAKEGVYQKVWYNILNDHPYPVKVVIVWGQGLQAFPDYDLVEAAIRHVVEDNNGIVVNVNIYPDEMAALSDYVLPETTFLEGSPTIGFSKSFDLTYRIHWADRIPPIYPEPKSEKWITRELAYRIGEKLGIPRETLESEYFPEYFLISGEEAIQKMLEEYNKKLGTSVTLEQLQKEKVITQPFKPKDLTKLKTPSGRIEILPTELSENGYDPLPKWRDSYTYTMLGEDEFVLVTSVFSMNRHSKTVNNVWLRKFLEKHHADKVWIHPARARRLGIGEGDVIIIESVRAFDPNRIVHMPKFKLKANVHVTEAVMPDVIFVPHGTGQLSKFMSSYAFGPLGGDSVIKPVLLNYEDPSASSADQDVIVRVVRIGG
ncbi:MAG: molybdopterin-dependent oxidoreductase [Desulfurococcales archaeon]|nr:molybdopterin-dependent oxidoreductase [Desulfurococcales archaeon]